MAKMMRPEYNSTDAPWLNDEEQITQPDITRMPTVPERSRISPNLPGLIGAGVSQRITDDLLTERIFRNVEDVVPIDEMDTLPSNVQEPFHRGLRRVAGGSSARLDSSIEEQDGFSLQVETGRLVGAQLPTDVGQTMQAQRFFLGRFFDDVRWWLLYPDRLELLLWLIGVFVLICVTVFLMLALIVSLRLFGSVVCRP